MRALRAIEARIAEATAVLAQTDAAALLGAGAAFGWTRRLRKRISAKV